MNSKPADMAAQTVMAKTWVRLVVAVIGAAGAVGAAVLPTQCHSAKSGDSRYDLNVPTPAESRRFQGRVQGPDGEAVEGAKITALLDTGGSVDGYSDSSGKFALAVPSGSKRLHIYVSASGFLAYDLEIDPGQQATVDVRLRARARLNTAPRNVRHKPESAYGDVSSSKTNAGQNSGAAACATGVVFCNPASNRGTQIQTNNYGAPRPAPQVRMIDQQPLHVFPKGLPPDLSIDFVADLEGQNSNYSVSRIAPFVPGVQVSFRVASDFEHPVFQLECDIPCVPTILLLSQSRMGSGRMNEQFPIRSKFEKLDTEAKLWRLRPTVSSGTLDEDDTVSVRLRVFQGPLPKVVSLIAVPD